MKHNMHIVILTAGYGNGHIQVARTLEQSLLRSGVRSVHVMDLYREAHPGLNSISRHLYLYSPWFSAYGLDYYGWSYYATKDLQKTSAIAKWGNQFGMKKLIALLQKQRPDAIINTFPFGGITEHLRKHGIQVPVFTVVTDFSLHNRWLFTQPDRYYVATADLKREMMERGVPAEDIVVSGIPVREPFYEPGRPPYPLAQSQTRRSLERTRSILVMMGAHIPLPDAQRIIAKLLALPDVRVDLVCGGNEKLRRRLERRFAGHERLRLFGYVEAIHDRMREADCIVTKAGGITLSEAIQIRTPIVVYKPFSGQERENARYLERKGAAVVASSPRALAEQVQELLDSEVRRARMLQQYDELAAGCATETIVRDVLRLTGHLPALADRR
ncbi:MGDG synthase family glycosyltransferase [Paenibacillus barengoltzii]|jgi:processive 1,2-diacylglycerol beta-glucosyltransferase|uniref:Monogalactosyldiacylglycerol synthase n=1 Tax=Paenibacillus barengoltzii J12 TaxID=935846 RepID=A0ABY1LVM6_9BACL|nr:glycosyltransferase [Paenibacillus barengoltzii]SMF14213.1 Monogalactosyldiacylglycerol synthase [Paenibacillus barengoltzii J12]SMF19727.1 Monogalactosyldiacylglycerol synthase [Paenibacillus barengoltzii]